MVHKIHQLQQSYPVPSSTQQKPEPKVKFKDFLTDQEIKISKHAKERLQERNIEIKESQWKTIEEKMSEARGKGIKDSLIVMNNATLLVSTKNNTIITAMNRKESMNRIFSNIDGTILINE